MRNKIAKWSRWLHLYTSMLGLAAILFFSVTGITLNHPDWFTEPVEQELSGQLDTAWLGATESEVKELEVAEYLRKTHHLRGSVEEFRVEEEECLVIFKGPGSSAEAIITSATGEYTLNTVSEGWLAYFNDLHKGRNTGAVWAWTIDIIAAGLIFISLSGLVLVFFIKRRRTKGLVLAVIVLLLMVLIAWRFVP